MAAEEFDAMMAAEFPEGMDLPEDRDIVLTPELRGVYFMMEALTQVAYSFHCEAELIELIEGDIDPGLFEGRVMDYLNRVAADGGGFIHVLDMLHEWESSQLAGRLGQALVKWKVKHGLADHIHAWVMLPLVGAIPLRLQTEDPVVILPLPRSALED